MPESIYDIRFTETHVYIPKADGEIVKLTWDELREQIK